MCVFYDLPIKYRRNTLCQYNKNTQSYLPSTVYSIPFCENRCSKIKYLCDKGRERERILQNIYHLARNGH